MNKLKTLILANTAFAFAMIAMVNTPMAAAPDGGPDKRPFARGGMRPGGFGGAPLISIALNHKSELNLSPDQIANLENIRTHYQSQVSPLHQQLQSLKKEIRTLLQQSPTSLIQVKSKIQASEKLRSELRYLHIEALENGKSILSQSQRDQLHNLVRSQHEQMRARRGQPS
ncbi:MAG: periplasmic heavy metal sensor [Deltaproteobacteria bacterium]|nr:periplasmic heavy metal sensor [Deltaproteobacteria bacterium]